MAVLIQQLIEGQHALITVDMNDSLDRALSLMIEHDFSQLPVLVDGEIQGADGSLVTSDSILRACSFFKAPPEELRVCDATVRSRVVAPDDDLFSQIEHLFQNHAVLVVGNNRELIGIVTDYDTADYFRRRASDMLMVENIETTLKSYIEETFRAMPDADALQAAIDRMTSHGVQNREKAHSAIRNFCQRAGIAFNAGSHNDHVQTALDSSFPISTKQRSFNSLNLSEYVDLACTTQCWDGLGRVFGISSTHFKNMMEGVRETRNSLMHFNPNITQVDRVQLRDCSKWFDAHPFIASSSAADEIEDENSLPSAENGEDMSEALDEIEDAELNEDADATDDKSVETVETKYQALSKHLYSIRQKERVILSFDEIEKIIWAKLPDAARENRSWWDNNPQARPHASQWLKVNRRVASVNMTTQRVTFARAREKEKKYIDFFSAVQGKLREHPDFDLCNANPSGFNWIPLYKFETTFPLKPSILVAFAQGNRLRVELYIDCNDGAINENIFETLMQQSPALEESIGHKLSWEPLENRRACRVAIYRKGSIAEVDVEGEDYVKWIEEMAIRLYQGVKKPLELAMSELSASHSTQPVTLQSIDS